MSDRKYKTQNVYDKYHKWGCIMCFEADIMVSFLNSLGPSDAYMRQWLTIIGSDNGLSPGRREAIIWSIAGILLIRPLGTNVTEILIANMRLKVLSGKRRPFCLGLNVLSS